MELVAMFFWLLLAPVSLLAARGVLLGRLSLGVQLLAGMGGTGLMVLFVFLEGPAGLAWAAMALAIVGVLAVSVAEVGLTSSERPAQPASAQAIEEWSAGWGGAALALFMLVAVLSAVAAVNGPTAF